MKLFFGSHSSLISLFSTALTPRSFSFFIITLSLSYQVFYFPTAEAIIPQSHFKVLNKEDMDIGLGFENYSQDTQKEITLNERQERSKASVMREKTFLVLYFDFSCPACVNFYRRNIDSLYEQCVQTNKIKIIFRPVSLTQPSKFASRFLLCKNRSEGETFKILKAIFSSGWMNQADYPGALEDVLKKAEVKDVKDLYSCNGESKDNQRAMSTARRADVIREDAIKVLKLEGVPIGFLNYKKIPVDSSLFLLLDKL